MSKTTKLLASSILLLYLQPTFADIKQEVGPHPYDPNSQGIEKYDPIYRSLFDNVWWLPLEYNDKYNQYSYDVIEAIVSYAYLQRYRLTVGKERKTVDLTTYSLGDAVGRLVYRPKNAPNWTCTATHVGNNYVVTAGHCIDNPQTAPTACSELKIEWYYRSSRSNMHRPPRENIVGQCQEIISWEFNLNDPNTIDHAIFRVDQAPFAKVDIDPKPSLEINHKVTQFSHPGGLPLIWSSDCEITLKPYQYFKHNCWGASGSSGSALIDTNTNKLVGVLSMGRDRTFFTVRNDVSPIGCFNVETGQIDQGCLNNN